MRLARLPNKTFSWSEVDSSIGECWWSRIARCSRWTSTGLESSVPAMLSAAVISATCANAWSSGIWKGGFGIENLFAHQTGKVAAVSIWMFTEFFVELQFLACGYMIWSHTNSLPCFPYRMGHWGTQQMDKATVCVKWSSRGEGTEVDYAHFDEVDDQTFHSQVQKVLSLNLSKRIA